MSMTISQLNAVNAIKNLLPELNKEAVSAVRVLVDKRYHETSTEKEEEDV